jgi:hypothetical protein
MLWLINISAHLTLLLKGGKKAKKKKERESLCYPLFSCLLAIAAVHES